MKFAKFNIAPEILGNLDKLGFKKPTDIQYKAIPHILKKEDVLAVAQTGTGKTAAFAIPVISEIHRRKRSRRTDGVKCLVMVPTHELAIQITEVFQEIGRGTKVKTFGIYGGVKQDPQIARLQKGIDIIIATPGRVFDLVNQRHLDIRRIQTLILDEADHMLDLGFLKDIQDLIRYIPARRQTLFFSATIDEKIKKLAYSLVSNPIRIQISPKNPVARNIEHGVMEVKMDDKRFFLERIINENADKKILAFVRTKIRAERVAKAMERVGIKALTIHSDKDQDNRNEVMRQFSEGKVKVLIATDVSARGIDIPDIDYVVNYDLPEQTENYVHRVGRTGRGRNKGQAISFVSPREQELLANIEEYLGQHIQVLSIEEEAYRETLELTREKSDWKTLMREAEEMDKGKRKKR
jgi:ATP-dependent RNA helicase RhlE